MHKIYTGSGLIQHFESLWLVHQVQNTVWIEAATHHSKFLQVIPIDFGLDQGLAKLVRHDVTLMPQILFVFVDAINAFQKNLIVLSFPL